MRRTPLFQVQIDFAGEERFALDLADGVPQLMELLELLGKLTLAKFREAVKTPARYIKLWENLTIEMLGGRAYRAHVMPMYEKIFHRHGKKLSLQCCKPSDDRGRSSLSS